MQPRKVKLEKLHKLCSGKTVEVIFHKKASLPIERFPEHITLQFTDNTALRITRDEHNYLQAAYIAGYRDEEMFEAGK